MKKKQFSSIYLSKIRSHASIIFNAMHGTFVHWCINLTLALKTSIDKNIHQLFWRSISVRWVDMNIFHHDYDRWYHRILSIPFRHYLNSNSGYNHIIYFWMSNDNLHNLINSKFQKTITAGKILLKWYHSLNRWLMMLIW